MPPILQHASSTAEVGTAERTRAAQPDSIGARPDWRTWLFGVLLALDGVALVAYQFVTFKYEVHSDSAVKVLLANEIVESGEFFPRDWVYANGDLYAFFTHTLAIPLVPLFGPGFVTHALVGLLISLGLWWVTSKLLVELGLERWKRLAALALLGSGLSATLAENLYGQATYGFIVLLNAARLLLALVFFRRVREPRVAKVILAATFVLTVLSTWNNPKRALVMFTVPFVTACALASRGRILERLRGPTAWLVASHLGGFVLGGVLATATNDRLNTVDPAAVTTWLAPDGIWRNGVHAILGLLGQLGGLPTAGAPVVSGFGIFEGLRLATGLMLLWAIVRAVRDATTRGDEPARLVGVFTVCSAGLALLFFVFTTLPDSVTPSFSSRYLVPALYFGLVLVMTSVAPQPSRPLIAAIAVATCFGIVTMVVPGMGAGSKWREAKARGETRLALIKYLETEKLSYGYATYWNAGALTLLSDGKVKVRQVQADAFPTPAHLHTSNRWYRPNAWQGESFMLFTEAELKRVDRQVLDGWLGSPAKLLTFGEYRLLVYPKNLSSLPGWSDVVDGAQRYDVAQTSPHRVGRYTAKTASSGSLTANAGERGELLYGPFVWLGAGRYRVTFDVTGDGVGPLGTLQVTARQSARLLAEQPLLPGPEAPKTLEFEVQTEERFVEFRVLTNGAGAVTVTGAGIERLPWGT